MFLVYWSEATTLEPLSKLFDSDKMIDALAFTEDCRKQGHRFVTMCSENPDSVGKPGVDVTGADYNWKKRRL